MTSAVEVRAAFPIDDVELSRLHAKAFGDAEPTILPWAARLRRHSVSWVGAFDGERLVGFVHACGDGGAHAFVLDTAVDPDYQRRGVGGALIEALRVELIAAGCEWLHVDFEPRFRAFYEACGFSPTHAGLRRLTDSGT
ncbi:GNAT family N-acetyltransferase [Agromyces sp. Leaf222]|uniref:GNAT family N-acetyltransferase n=1 Tax=Agromyces sp. Leaf222 TaxID=1735688 RepID=UPI0006FA320F|nr:GNAT family N-acetyltransferase [Agromyces sp. Leaf222]KQM84214.1 acetyltransferase [Agromyces sp. Leaf222]